MNEEFETWFNKECLLDDPSEYNIANQGWNACKQKVLDIIQNTTIVGVNRSSKTALWEMVKKIKKL